MLAEAPLLWGCEKRKKTPTLSTNVLSYQQKWGFTPNSLALHANPYKFVLALKL